MHDERLKETSVVNALLIAFYLQLLTPSALCTTNIACLITQVTPLLPNGDDSDLTLVEEAEDLACDVLSSRLLMIHDASGSGENDVAELTRRKKLRDPFLEILDLNIVARADDASLVDAAGRD